MPVRGSQENVRELYKQRKHVPLCNVDFRNSEHITRRYTKLGKTGLRIKRKDTNRTEIGKSCYTLTRLLSESAKTDTIRAIRPSFILTLFFLCSCREDYKQME